MTVYGQIYKLKGNEPILLDDPQKVWVVQSGSIALFAVTVKDGVVEGTRRYLFSVEAEQALFGTATKSDQQHRQILAVPIGEAKLLQVDRQYLAELFTKGEAKAIAWLEGWLSQLGNALSQVSLSPIQVQAGGGETLSLSNGQTFQPEGDAICWVKLEQGTADFLGFEQLTLSKATGVFPLSKRMGLQAVGRVDLTTYATHQLPNLDTLLVGLSQLNTQFLFCIDLLDQRLAAEEMVRLSDRQRLNRQVTEKALQELASTINPQQRKFPSEDNPLLAAAGAVGRVLGINIRPPDVSENLKRVKEPLEAIARASRVRMRRVLLVENWWHTDCGPLVAYREDDNRPVALLPSSTNSYKIYDPVEQSLLPVNRPIATTLKPTAYMFYRSLPDKALSAWQLLRFAFKNRAGDLVVVLGTGVAVTLLGMLTAAVMAMMIDKAIPDSDRGLSVQIGLGLLVAALGTALFMLAQGLAMLRIETTGDSSTQAAVWDRLLNLPVSFFRQYTTGDLQNRASSISTIRRQLSGRSLVNLISSMFALFYLGQLFYYNSKLALVAVVVTIILLSVTTVSGLLLLNKIPPLLELQGNIFGQTVQLINGISKLHVAGAQERAFADWSKNYSRQIKLELTTQRVEDTVALVNTVMPTLTSGIIFWFTANLIQEAQNSGEVGLSLGTFLAFNTALGQFLKGSTDLSNTITEVLPVIPQWKRTQPILGTIPEVDLRKANPGQLKGKIVLDRVNFRYQTDKPLNLENVSISAEPGEFIALVGPSGSGKSTILRLLLGFETPESGGIYYDGQDLSELDVDAVRRQLGVVLQNGRLIAASIFENIACGTQITLAEAWEAARRAGLADDIVAMPMTMHTVISEGASNISAGQRQRLLIARALALKPQVLLFDEATSALDNKVQAIVSENLDKLQVTRIVIAHRLSTIRNAHRIYVLQDGRIVEQGNFEELANAEGLFTQLITRQMA
ncbi:MAG: NHLP bacteriocin export ABC transporter permease/ATPase subunit [Coleofasciculaceae cyanobacterium]